MKTLKTIFSQTGLKFSTWNPVTGSDSDTTAAHCHPTKLNHPWHWIKPRVIAVSNTSDLFHDSVRDKFLDRVFAAMALSEQHTFLVLTKRPERMREYLSHPLTKEGIGLSNEGHVTPDWLNEHWPLKNVWLGVSVEDQKTADERIPALLDTPAAMRWINAEPLLGNISLDCITGANAGGYGIGTYNALSGTWMPCVGDADEEHANKIDLDARIDWAVAGGELGAHARPIHPRWARSLIDQCKNTNTPFLFKQWGEWAPETSIDNDGSPGHQTYRNNSAIHVCEAGERVYRVGNKRAGRLLDGEHHNSHPDVKSIKE